MFRKTSIRDNALTSRRGTPQLQLQPVVRKLAHVYGGVSSGADLFHYFIKLERDSNNSEP